jgi:HPt (histidine-containing phosphotransfer) domain-containing protein
MQIEELSRAIGKFRSGFSLLPAPAASGLSTIEEHSLAIIGTAPITPGAIDTNILGKVREMLGQNATQLLSNVIDLYLDDVQGLLAAMRTGMNQGDTGAVRRAAHKLKSTSAVLGATALAHWCDELEQIGRAGMTTDGRELVLEIEAECTRVKAALDLERASGQRQTGVA